jgi:hypothetical protein
LSGAGLPRIRRACPDRQSLDGFTAGVGFVAHASKALLPKFCYLQPYRTLLDERQPHQTLDVDVRYLSRSMGNAP